MWGVIFGSIGLGFFVYDKKQKAVIPLLSGIGLMVLPSSNQARHITSACTIDRDTEAPFQKFLLIETCYIFRVYCYAPPGG